MSNNKQKLELTWIGKNNPEYDIANIEPRILEENPELSNCTNDPNTENMIIHGDNLLALKALLPEYEGKVKCIYIDPPYNTGNAFEHYDDSVEHSTWLSLMKPRLELLKMLLKDDGSIWVSIDETEFAYLKVLLDEVFGRNNFIASITVVVKTEGRRYGVLAKTHEYIIGFAKDINTLDFNEILVRDKVFSFNDIKGGFNVRELRNQNVRAFNSTNRPNLRYPFYVDVNNINENGHMEVFLANIGDKQEVWPITVNNLESVWRWGKEKALNEKDDLLARKGSDGVIRIFQKARSSTEMAKTTWTEVDVTTNRGTKESQALFGEHQFAFPKPEYLIAKIIEIASNENELVLDSFLGSGTTSAVAQKMNRKYIGIEMGDHAYTHCKVRLDKVIDGTDQGGISKAVEWNSGGAYKFYELAPSFIVKDEFGNPVIDDFYNDAKLIKVMCKLMNFTYKPSQTEYWKHGIGQGKNYLYVTTQLLTSGMVQQIAQHLTTGESLIICPKKFEPGAEKIDNRITIKKIPQSVLKACHFGKKEYLLPIKETAMEEVETEDESEDNE